MNYWSSYFLILFSFLLLSFLMTASQILLLPVRNKGLGTRELSSALLLTGPICLASLSSAITSIVYVIHIQTIGLQGFPPESFYSHFTGSEWYYPLFVSANVATDILFLTPLITLPGIIWIAYPRRNIRFRIFGTLFLLVAAFVLVNASGAVKTDLSELASLSVSVFMGMLFLLFSVLVFAMGKENRVNSIDFRALLRGFALSFLLFLPYYILSVCGKHLWAGKTGGLPSPVFHPFIAVTLLSILLALSLLRLNLAGENAPAGRDMRESAAEYWGLSPREREVLPLLFEGRS